MSFRWMTTGGALLGMLFLAGCGSDKELVLYRPGDVPVWRTVENSPPLRRPVAPRTPPATASTPETSPEVIPPADTQPSESMANYPQVTLKTSQGDITIALYEDKAPITVANFLQYVDSDHYDGLIFHRVIPGFMIQGGGMDASMAEKPTMAPIKNEAKNSVPNKRGTLAMARTNVLDSATSQFFINLVDNNFLNGNGITGGYAVFGEVVSGMDVVDAIGRTATGRKGYHSDVPVTPIVIQDVVRVEAK